MKARSIISVPLDERHTALTCSECGALGVSLSEQVLADLLRHFNQVHHLGAAPV